MNHKDFFEWNGHYDITITLQKDERVFEGTFTLEQLYQMFKARMAEEAAQEQER